ncbi:MAG: hypothetical protein QNK37_17745 [Acidobacteriota bacterium]|nr:hypothetical protein [Acidobacteriota bacterium]
MTEKIDDVPVFPVTVRQMALAVGILCIVWFSWVKGAFFEDEQQKMYYALIPGLIGLFSCLLAVGMKLIEKKGGALHLHLWRIGLIIQTGAFFVFIILKLFFADQS